MAADLGWSERIDWVQILPIGKDSIRTFLSLPDDMPKGLYERLDWGLGCGLMLNIEHYCSRGEVAPDFDILGGREGLNLGCWVEFHAPLDFDA